MFMKTQWSKTDTNPVLSIVHGLAKRDSNVALSEIERNAKGLSRNDIVTALQDLQKQGVGEYVVGRRGFPSRFVVGARTAAKPNRVNNAVRIESVNYSIKLSSGTGRIELPASMSERDIAAIESFISNLKNRSH